MVFTFHLFAESVIWCSKSVPLAIDGWGSTPPNCIHFPMGVVIVHHMEVPVPTSAYYERLIFTVTLFQLYNSLLILEFNYLGIRWTSPSPK